MFEWKLFKFFSENSLQKKRGESWKEEEKIEKAAFQILISITWEMCRCSPELKGKSAVVQRRRLCTTNSFPPMLEKSDHSESDRKLIQAHWRAGGILVVIHPNPKHYNSCMAWGETTWGGGIQRGIWMKNLTSEKQEIISSFFFPFVKTHVSWLNP